MSTQAELHIRVTIEPSDALVQLLTPFRQVITMPPGPAMEPPAQISLPPTEEETPAQEEILGAPEPTQVPAEPGTRQDPETQGPREHKSTRGTGAYRLFPGNDRLEWLDNGNEVVARYFNTNVRTTWDKIRLYAAIKHRQERRQRIIADLGHLANTSHRVTALNQLVQAYVDGIIAPREGQDGAA